MNKESLKLFQIYKQKCLSIHAIMTKPTILQYLENTLIQLTVAVNNLKLLLNMEKLTAINTMPLT